MRLSSSGQEFLKWLALGLMLVDHAAAVFLEPSTGAYVLCRLAGRSAFPLFAALMAYNVVHRGVDPLRYVRPLLIVGLLSQLPYVWALDLPVWRLNIMFPLLVGVLLVRLWLFEGARWWLWWMLGAVAVVAVGSVADYGYAGVFLVPVWALFWRWPVVGVGLVVAAVVAWLNWGGIGAPAGLLVFALLPLGVSTLQLRRLPRWVAYAFYPGHLAALAVLSLSSFLS